MATTRWVVVLEVAKHGEGRVSLAAVEALMQAVRDCRPTALYSADRYAFQLWIDADGPAEALLTGLSRWREATRVLGVPEYELARAEILTPAEFARDLENAELTSGAPSWLVADEAAVRTSALLVTAEDPSEAVALVCSFVEELGGTIVPAGGAAPNEIELSLGTAIPLAAVAPDGQVGHQLRELLPAVVETARVTVERLGPARRRRVRAAPAGRTRSAS